jgi:hypothetical protein
MGRGVPYEAAHGAALGKYGVSPFSLYDPSVIQANPTLFALQFGVVQVLGVVMMKLIDRGLARVRLWRGEGPGASYAAEEIIERRISPTKRAEDATSSSVAIEVWLPMGPRALFGLLGVRYERDGPACEIRAPVVRGLDGVRLSDTIAAANDEVRVGLPDEYGRAVVDSLAHEAEVLGLHGRLSVENAAHSLVGSSRSVFAALSTLAVRLIVEPFDELEQGSIEEIVRGALNRVHSQAGRVLPHG